MTSRNGVPNLAPRTVALVILLAGAGSARGWAQGTPPGHGAMQQHGRMADSTMMTSPHHLLGMAYRDNLFTFARVLQDDVKRTNAVQLDLAKPAVAEMRRLFDKLSDHYKTQAAKPGETHAAMSGQHMMAQMPMTKDQMQSHLKSLDDAISGLELEIRASPLNPARVLEFTEVILKHCDGMRM